MTYMCVLCQTVFAFPGAWPLVCPKCHKPGNWRSVQSDDPPSHDYTVNRNDRRFLKSLRIDPEA